MLAVELYYTEILLFDAEKSGKDYRSIRGKEGDKTHYVWIYRPDIDLR